MIAAASLFALAGGVAGPGDEDILGCCGGFVVLPAVVLLILVAWLADALWAGWTALAVAGLAYLIASLLVAGYKPSDDREVAEEQACGQRLVERYARLTAVAAGGVMAVGVRRAGRWARPRKLPAKRRLTPAERRAVVQEMSARGLVSAKEAAELRRRLKAVAEGEQADEPRAPGDSAP